MLWAFRSILFLALAALFGWTFYQNAAPSGVFSAFYDFENETPFITPLSPGDRVLPIEKSAGKSYQPMIEDPVYFRIRAPRSFTSAKITLRFRNESNVSLRLAGLVSWENYEFDFKELDPVYPEGDWRIGTVEFDLSKLFAPDGRTYTFAISAPGLQDKGGRILVSGIWAELQREPESIFETLRYAFTR